MLGELRLLELLARAVAGAPSVPNAYHHAIRIVLRKWPSESRFTEGQLQELIGELKCTN